MLMLETVLLFGIVIELLLVFNIFWKARLLILSVSLLTHFGLFGLLIAQAVNPWLLLILPILLFRVVNLSRILSERKQPQYLRTSATRTVLVLAGIQLVAWIVAMALQAVDTSTLLVVLATTQLCVALLFLGWVANSIHQTTYHKHEKHLTDKELPAITVAIPARNETADLKSCIDSIIASNYPKLEILVLDDCSQDKTPEVIKQYAHAGVRFIEGTAPPANWLAKNHAYNQLAEEASGSYIVFCGVDVRMSPGFLRNLVSHLKLKKKRMMSVMPTRLTGDLRSSFFQPMRYWWEHALPRRYMNKPAVLSTCWVIDRKILQKLGGFKGVKQTILPERYFARECVKHDAYSFIRADENLDLRTTKIPIEQIRTAARMRYPQLRNRPENVLLFTLMLQTLLVLPYALFISSFIWANPLLQILSGITVGLLTLTHVIILIVSNPATSITGLLSFPFVVMSDNVITIYSMLKYEFGQVIWKGRNVCLPILNGPDDTRLRRLHR